MKQKEKTALKQLVPELRFPKFADAGDWEEKRIGDLCDVQDGFSFKSTDFINEGPEKIQVVRITDINNFNKNNSKVYVSKSVLTKIDLTKYFTEKGDLLLSLTGAAGFNFLIWNGERSLLNQRTAKITPKGNQVVRRIIEPLVYDKINTKGEGQNNNLSKEFLLDVKIPIPSLPEQQKIADCLSSLDEVISLESQKLQSLQSYKKGLLQNLFPAEGETVPKLRFPEFVGTGNWEERKLGDFIRERNEMPEPETELYSLTIENGITPKTERYERAFLVKNEKEAYKSVHPNDFALNPMNLRFGAIGKNNNYRKVSISKYYNVFYCDRSMISDFLEKYLKTDALINIYDDIAIGTLIEKRRVHFVNFLKLSLPIPTIPEQQKIADFLSSVDAVMQEQSQKVEGLKAHKKGLLQGLFPVMGE